MKGNRMSNITYAATCDYVYAQTRKSMTGTVSGERGRNNLDSIAGPLTRSTNRCIDTLIRGNIVKRANLSWRPRPLSWFCTSSTQFFDVVVSFNYVSVRLHLIVRLSRRAVFAGLHISVVSQPHWALSSLPTAIGICIFAMTICLWYLDACTSRRTGCTRAEPVPRSGTIARLPR